MASSNKLSCGVEFAVINDLKESLESAARNGFEFTCLPVVHPRFKREFLSGKSKERPGAFTRSDMILNSQDWSSLVVGRISSYLDCESSDDDKRRLSEMTLLQELSYCSHLSLSSIMISLNRAQNSNLARIVHEKLNGNYSPSIWIRVPLIAPSVMANSYRDKSENSSEPDTWEWWNVFRTLCNNDKRLGVALEIGSDLPSEDVITRWLGEPVRCLVLPTEVFITNKKGYPVLSKPHQYFLRSMTVQSINVQCILTGARRHELISYYVQYLDHLWKTITLCDTVSCYAKGYEDYLQCPLQPLMDNLESQTYEVFEKDPVKYTEYQRAIYTALIDRVPFEEKDTNVQVVMVVGAGRGPLVTAAINAATRADRRIKLYAVEKNPNAIVTLHAQQDEIWENLVTIVASDMREWNPPELADILVSELLGSFGDNELSPECLDGAQKFLKDNGISIPLSYSSYICPLHSPKLHIEVRSCKDKDKPSVAPFETPYVVHQQNKYNIAPVQRLFTFTHPNRDLPPDNTRFKTLTFKVEQNCVLHGFSGFFDTILYKDITLSIVPQTHSQNMFSWFPIFFPIKEPVNLLAGQDLVVHFWRLCSKQNVWYEWTISEPIPLPIHNPNGRSYTIGL